MAKAGLKPAPLPSRAGLKPVPLPSRLCRLTPLGSFGMIPSGSSPGSGWFQCYTPSLSASLTGVI